VWTPIVATAGADCVSHDLRHTAATRLIRDDRWSPAEVQRFLGHRDPRITLAIYTHVTAEDLPTPSSLRA
jgi:integrase